MLKKIFLSTSNVQTVPAVNGGAIETLIDILIAENEVKKECFFYVLCVHNKIAEEKAKNLKYTKIIYYKSLNDFKFVDFFKIEIYQYIYFKLLSLINGKNCPPRYYFFSYQLCKRIKPDYFVAEGGIYRNYELIKRVIEPGKRFAHLHRTVEGNHELHSLFPNAIAVSNYIRDKYINSSQRSNISVETVYNCCDEKVFLEKPQQALVQKKKDQFNIKDDDFIIVFTGRVVEEKGVLELIKAVKQINISKIKLFIIGSPFFKEYGETKYRKEVQRYCDLYDFIIMTGYVPNQEIPIYYEISDLSITPSVYEEPGAITPLEAMSFGLPVIITDSGGMKEYQKDDCLKVVNRKPNLINNLSKEIKFLYENPKHMKSMSIAGQKRSKDFSSADFYKNFLAVFDIK